MLRGWRDASAWLLAHLHPIAQPHVSKNHKFRFDLTPGRYTLLGGRPRRIMPVVIKQAAVANADIPNDCI